jgi:hypothetical protein
MKIPATQAEHVRQLRSAALPRVRQPNGKLLNHLQIRSELQRRIGEKLTPNHPNESPTLRRSRERKAERAPLPTSYQPQSKAEAAYMRDHPRSKTAKLPAGLKPKGAGRRRGRK